MRPWRCADALPADSPAPCPARSRALRGRIDDRARPRRPPEAQAATCVDYANQAAAQRAADTRDANGNGVYCDALKCSCLKPGGSAGSSPTPSAAPTDPRLGTSVTLAPVRRTSDCRVRGPLPDRGCTPGGHGSRA
jgi:hypothetical protein